MLFVKLIWIALSISILCFSLYRLRQLNAVRDVSELIAVMSYGMMIISLPIGIASFIAVIAFGLISNAVGIYIENDTVSIVVIWLAFFIGGFIQWFMLLNKITRKNN